MIEHKQGCDALGGYGHGVGPCTCGAVAPVEAQAVPDQPVAIKPCPFCGEQPKLLDLAGWEIQCACGCDFWQALPDKDELVAAWNRRPTPAAADLHQQIMNLPCVEPEWSGPARTTREVAVAAFRMGHKQARHAAAQLVAASSPAAAGVPTGRALPKPGTEEVSKALDAMLAEYDFPCNSKNAARAGWEAANRWLLAASPVAPVGAPTRQLEELIDQYWTLAYAEGKEGRNHDTEDGAAQQCLHDIKEAIALLSRQGCELATDATKQREREHSVHLAATPIDQDFRMRPASSEAAPSAKGSEKQKLTMRISYERSGRCFWHLQCTAQRHAPPMAIDHDDKEGKRTLLRCTACARAGWYPYGSVGEVCCEELTEAQPVSNDGASGSPSSYRARPSDPDLNPVSVKDLSASASPATKEQQ